MNDTKFKNQANVVVIGGGVAGCSVLYHLTQEGITDVILVERDSLTSGSTWHAAVQVTQFGGNQTMSLRVNCVGIVKNTQAFACSDSYRRSHPFCHAKIYKLALIS
ncbi:MAG: FAD-dependent oxidoreductase [Alphaproteobacteria bacterium]|nr:FAD-dependent oxidoreductase [Alphaproteobacteria bacterium]